VKPARAYLKQHLALQAPPWLLLRRVFKNPVAAVCLVVVVTLVAVAGLEFQFMRSQLSAELDTRISATAHSFQARVPDGVAAGADLARASSAWLGAQPFADGVNRRQS